MDAAEAAPGADATDPKRRSVSGGAGGTSIGEDRAIEAAAGDGVCESVSEVD